MKRLLLCALVVVCVGLAVSSDRITAKGQIVVNSATCVSYKVLADGRVQVQWNDGQGTTFSSFEEMRTFALSGSDDADLPRKYLLLWWLARQPDGSNPNLMVGKTLTFDPTAAQFIRVQ